MMLLVLENEKAQLTDQLGEKEQAVESVRALLGERDNKLLLFQEELEGQLLIDVTP